MSKVFHWADDNLRRDREAGPPVFEVPGTAWPLPEKPQLPAIMCSPGMCERLGAESAPIVEAILERGLRFDRHKLESLLDECLTKIEGYNGQLPKGYTSASALLQRYTGSRYDEPYGGISIQRECNLWATFNYVLPVSEIGTIMARLRPKRLAALITNVLAALDGERVYQSPVFAAALGGVLAAFDPREICFPSLVGTIQSPSLVVHLPELSLRALAYASGDRILSEIFADADPWALVYQRVHGVTGDVSAVQKDEARELTLGTIFGSGIGAANEWFCRLYLPGSDLHPGAPELYATFIKSLSGLTAFFSQIDQATCDFRMQHSSRYSYPNPQKAREQKRRLLRENALAVHRQAGLTIAQNAQLVAAVGDHYIVEVPKPAAADLGEAIKENLTALFSFPLHIEITA